MLFASGDEAIRMTVRGGRVTEVAPAAPAAAARIRIVATDEGWQQMLRPVPPPFYQDLFGAASRHGVLLGEPEDVFPYYPALRRLMELLRTVEGEG